MKHKFLFYFLLLNFIFGIQTVIYPQKGNFDSLTNAIRQSGNLKQEINLITKLCKKHKYVFPDSCLNYITKCLAKNSNVLNDDNVFLMQLEGDIYWHFGQLTVSLDKYSAALDYYTKTNNKKGIMEALGNVGYVKMEQGNYPEALIKYKESLKIAREIKDEEYTGIVSTYVAQLYDWLGETEQALKSYHELRIHYLKRNERKNYGVIFLNIGSIYVKNSNYDSALYYFNKAITELPPEQERSIAIAKMNMAYTNLVQGKNLDDCKKILDEIAPVFKKLNSMSNLTHVTYYYGIYYHQLKQYTKAKNIYLSILAEYINTDQVFRLSSIYERISDVYEKLNNKDSALICYKLFKRFNDSLLTDLTENNMSYQRVLFDMDKKQLEIEKLEQKQQVQNVQLAKEKTQRYALVGGVVLLLIFGVFIYNRFKVTQKQKKIIEDKEKETQYQKMLIEEKQKEIVDSINYAKRIQYTLLAHDEFLKDNLKEHFILFRPKDIVSGDFYWATKKGDKFYLAVCDSTGHGVPGAFMSLLNIGFLTEAINEKGIELPNKVFDFVRQRLIDNVSKEGQKDGFDGILICIDSKSNRILYSAANNSPILISNGSLIEMQGDRMPVGEGERKEEFNLFSFDTKPGDTLYLYTDGYADQFGGEKGKKFKYKQLNELLTTYNTRPLDEQKNSLKTTFEKWKGNLEQVDDVCVVGIRL